MSVGDDGRGERGVSRGGTGPGARPGGGSGEGGRQHAPVPAGQRRLAAAVSEHRLPAGVRRPGEGADPGREEAHGHDAGQRRDPSPASLSGPRGHGHGRGALQGGLSAGGRLSARRAVALRRLGAEPSAGGVWRLCEADHVQRRRDDRRADGAPRGGGEGAGLRLRRRRAAGPGRRGGRAGRRLHPAVPDGRRGKAHGLGSAA